MPPTHPQVVELRQYTLRPQQRDALIELFDREFVESQEAEGMGVMGQFRDLGDPDRFVWLRGFADMPSRARGLRGFYGGPVWAAHRDAANATMIDSDDVLLLRPAWHGAGLAHDPARRAGGAGGLVAVTVFTLNDAASPALLDVCRERMASVLQRDGALAQGWYVTEPSPNNFPRLPVREGEHVLVSVAVFKELTGRNVTPALSQWLKKPPHSLNLAPTARSAIHA
ncbi:NIPSNAP family protein [Massilia sp.]|uniref:NIPSNAP family protein n=1 Tax=Massilia sp. TaxID=1882437 RepID=UPI00352FE593